MSDILEEIKLLYSQYLGNTCYKLSEEQLKYINDNTPLLQTGEYKLGTKLKWIIEGITEFPKCKVCRQRVQTKYKAFILLSNLLLKKMCKQ